MIMPFKNILTIVSANSENLENYFRKIFADVRSSGSKKTSINVFTDLKYSDLVAIVREALLENIDIGYELYLWKKEEVKKFFDYIGKTELDGLLIYCDDENRVFVSKIIDNLPNNIKTNLIKDYCRRSS